MFCANMEPVRHVTRMEQSVELPPLATRLMQRMGTQKSGPAPLSSSILWEDDQRLPFLGNSTLLRDGVALSSMVKNAPTALSLCVMTDTWASSWIARMS